MSWAVGIEVYVSPWAHDLFLIHASVKRFWFFSGPKRHVSSYRLEPISLLSAISRPPRRAPDNRTPSMKENPWKDSNDQSHSASCQLLVHHWHTSSPIVPNPG